MAKLLKNDELVKKIHEAIAIDDESAFKSFLDEAVVKKVNINFINPEGHSALTAAAAAGRDNIVAILLEQPGINIDHVTNGGETALHFVAEKGYNEILTMLINAGLAIDIRTVQGKTPLQLAQENSQKESAVILAENGAHFQDRRLVQRTDAGFYDKAKNMLTGFEEVVNKSLGGMATREEFVIGVVVEVDKCLGSKIVNFDNPRLQEGLNRIFDQIAVLRKEKDISGQRYKALNIVRKLIVCINECSVNIWRQLNRTSEIYLFSKAESLIEEDIVHAKTSQIIKITRNSEESLASVFVEKTEAKVEPLAVKADWYKSKKHGSFEEFVALAECGKNKQLSYFPFVAIERDKILCKLSNDNMYLLDTVTITPNDISSKAEVMKLASQKMFVIDGSRQQIDNVFNREMLTSKDLLELDKLMRSGKREKMHIINFLPRTGCYENSWADMTEEAFVTGAVIHGFNYPGVNFSEGEVKCKNDLIYAGITMVNKLLDQGVHPDKIILQGYCSGIDIVLEVVRQFKITGIIELAYFSYNSYKPLSSAVKDALISGVPASLEKVTRSIFTDWFGDVGPRKLCAYAEGDSTLFKSDSSDKIAKNGRSTDSNGCLESFREIRDFLDSESQAIKLALHAGVSKSNPNSWPLKDIETKSGLTYFQLLCYFISHTQEFFRKNKEFQNPCLPKERVDKVADTKNDQKSSNEVENMSAIALAR